MLHIPVSYKPILTSFQLEFEIVYFVIDTIENKKLHKAKWSKIENKLTSCLQTSAVKSDKLSENEKEAWRVSVTEMEVKKGILDRHDSKHRSLCFIRNIKEFDNITDLGENDVTAIGRNVELSSTCPLVVDQGVQHKINDLRRRVRANGVHVESWQQSWAPGGITKDSHKAYIEEFGERFYEIMTSRIDNCLATQERVDDLVREVSTHSVFCLKKCKTFFGREELVSRGLDHFTQSTDSPRQPFVIHGVSGSGKTALMSVLATRGRTMLPTGGDPVLVVRFCGTTPSSSSAREVKTRTSIILLNNTSLLFP